MDVQIKSGLGWITIIVLGRIDSFNFELVTSKLGILLRMGNKKIALDLDKARFLSVPTVRYFVNSAKYLEKQGGELVVLNCPRDLRNTFDIFNVPKRYIEFRERLEEF